MRTRSARLAHGQHTTSPYHVPDLGQHIAYQANRAGGAERFHDPAVHKTIAGDLARITDDDALLRDLELASVQTAQQHEAHTLSWLQTVPGIGKILRRVRLYDIPDIRRFPSGQAFASYARVVKCRKESAGQRVGTSGKHIGNAPLKWALSEAATLCLRNHPNGQKLLTRVEQKPGTGNTRTILAHKRARAVYDMLKRTTAFDTDIFLRT